MAALPTGEVLKPADAEQLGEALRWAVAETRPLEVVGGGSKRQLGRPVQSAALLDLSALSKIENYEPEELVLSARAATPLAEIEAALAARDQMLAFEPADYGRLYATANDCANGAANGSRATLGGALACNLSGPRRIKAGAARDHLLGFKAVSGRAETFKAGGRVVKNVTGYDLCKLLAGSYGTLAVMSEVTIKVLPAPERTRTVLLFGLDDAAAIGALGAAVASPHEVSGAAHLPVPAARRSAVAYVSGAGAAVTAVRVEGFGPSVLARCAALRAQLGDLGAIEELHSKHSLTLWQEVRDATLLGAGAEGGAPRSLWRLSVPPSEGPGVAARLQAESEAEALFDWAGGLVWLAVAPSADAAHEAVRASVAAAGGHATLIRAAPEVRATVPVFQPQPPALAALSARIKANFDPAGVLNPGRMYAGV